MVLPRFKIPHQWKDSDPLVIVLIQYYIQKRQMWFLNLTCLVH